MKVISNPDSRIFPLISQSIPAEGTVLKRSAFVLSFTVNNRWFLFNTLTREFIDYGTAELPEKIVIQNCDDDTAFLIAHHFLVKEDTDECQTYCSVVSVLRAMNNTSAISTYTILPTTFCNARCFYCYELDYHFTSMDDTISEKMCDFIEKTHGDQKIHIRWFGGEPLLARKTIDKVCVSLKEKRISYDSFVVTNGSLFDQETAAKAVSLWHVKTVQITLDGDEQEYNSRKRYFDTSVSPFQKVLQSMHSLLAAGIQVQIRINMDFDNIQSVLHLADTLNEHFPDKTNLGVYVHPLFLAERSGRCNEIWQASLDMEDRFESMGFRIPKARAVKPVSSYYCIAPNPSCAVIGADGRVYACEHCHADSLLGQMDSELKKRKTGITVSDVREKCRNCPYLPYCTEYAECPDLVYDCRSVREIKIMHSLKKLI